MRYRVALALLAMSLLVTLTTSALSPSPSAAAEAQSGVTMLTAGVVQPGSNPAASTDARILVRVSFTPVRKGRPVVIQRLGPLGLWEDVATVKTGANGVASFIGASRAPNGAAYQYRGVAKRYDGLPKFTATAASAAEWKTTFGAEFTGTRLGRRWKDRPSESSSRKCSKVGDPRARSLSGDGTLSLRVMRDPDRMNETCRVTVNGKRYRFKYWLNGQLSTQTAGNTFAQTYGMFAARIKFPEKRGKHGGFWMQPTQPRTIPGNPKASGAEIDTVEFFGRGYPDGGLASFLYNYGVLDRNGHPRKIGGMAPSATRMLPNGDAWWKNYHVFSLEWTPKRYIFRVDGREHFRTSTGVSGIDEYLILSLLSSDWELRDAQKLGIRPMGTMKVDWVRAWQR